MAIVLATKKLIYCHMPKTGGDFTTRYLRDEHGGKDPPGFNGHVSWNDLPARYKDGRTPFGTIRDPWSWYASWYMHAKAVCLEQGGLASYGNGSKNFADVLEGALHPLDGRAPNNVGLIWSLDIKATRPSFLREKVGLYSWTFNYIFSKQVRTLIDTPQLYEGLEEFLGTPVDRKKHPPKNTRHQRSKTAVDDVSTLYTDELIDAVWKADGQLIRELGYTEPFQPHNSAIINY